MNVVHLLRCSRIYLLTGGVCAPRFIPLSQFFDDPLSITIAKIGGLVGSCVPGHPNIYNYCKWGCALLARRCSLVVHIRTILPHFFRCGMFTSRIMPLNTCSLVKGVSFFVKSFASLKVTPLLSVFIKWSHCLFPFVWAVSHPLSVLVTR